MGNRSNWKRRRGELEHRATCCKTTATKNTALMRPLMCVTVAAAVARHGLSAHAAASVAFPATLPPAYQSSDVAPASRTPKKGSDGKSNPRQRPPHYGDGSSDDSDEGGVDDPESHLSPEEESSSSDFHDLPPLADEAERDSGQMGAFRSRDDNVIRMRAGGAHDGPSRDGDGVAESADEAPVPRNAEIMFGEETTEMSSSRAAPAPLEAGEHTAQSQPLKTLKKLQAMLDDSDYATATASGSTPPSEVRAVQTSNNAAKIEFGDSVSAVSNSSVGVDDEEAGEETDSVTDQKSARAQASTDNKLWTSKDRSKYKKQRRLREERERREKEQIELQRKRWHQEQMSLYDGDITDGTEVTDASDDGDGLSNLPVYLSDTEGNTDEFDIEPSRGTSPSSQSQHRNTQPRAAPERQQKQQPHQHTPLHQTHGSQYQHQHPAVPYGYQNSNPDGSPIPQQQGQYPQQPPPLQYQPGYPYPPYGAPPNDPNPYSQQQQQQYAAQYAAWAAAAAASGVAYPPPPQNGAMPPPPMNPASAGYPNYPPRPLGQGQYPQNGFYPRPYVSPPSGPAATSRATPRLKANGPGSRSQAAPVEAKPMDQESLPVATSGAGSSFMAPGIFQGQTSEILQVDYGNKISLAEASTMITFDSIQKLSFLVIGVMLMCYCAVSPRKLPVVEYNMRFKENVQIASLVLIAPLITSISVFDAKESDINKLISTFSTAFTVGYVASFVLEVIFTTILRLAVFTVWEPAIFKLTPKVPTIVLPWVLRENKYRPKRITLFAADFASSCLAAPIIEEYVKLKVVELCVKLPRNYQRSKKKNTSCEKGRAKTKKRRRTLERIERGALESEVTNINSYVTTMLAASMGLKLCDSTRRILMYTKRTDANKAFYAFVRGVFPIHDLCATMTALDLAKRNVLGVDMPLWRILLPAVFIHGMANFRGMKPIFKWNSSTPWSEMQLSPWNVADDSTLGQLLNKGFAKLMWLIILGRVLGYCIKNYYLIGRQAVKRTTTYAGKQAAFSAELAAAEMLKKSKDK